MSAIIQFSKSIPARTEAIIIPVIDGKIKSEDKSISTEALKRVKALMKEDNSTFDGKAGSAHKFSVSDGNAIIWYIFIGLDKKATRLDIEKAGGKAFAALSSLKVQSVAMVSDFDAEYAAAFGNGFLLRSYRFMKYKTKDKEKQPKPMTLSVVCQHKANAEKAFEPMKAVTEAVFFARDKVSEPPNTLYPESYVAEIKKLMKGTSVKLTILDEKKLEKMGAGALLAVGKASERKPRLVIMDYDGRAKKNKSDKPLALVGKGVTYDTGGYSLKPRGSMEGMKMDMGGSAAVVGAVKALAELKADVRVVGVVALAENMIAGNAYRVDDVLTSLSGQTIEVLNTDAEGRLCLADALTYVQDNYDPKAVIDAATLTGACMAALGLEMAGVFTPAESLEKSFRESGNDTGDDFWPLPVNKAFDKLMDSPIADMRNLATSPFGGASTAAAFLQRFITNDRPWAHLDIAGTAWRKEDSDLCPKGASGFGVRAMVHWVLNY